MAASTLTIGLSHAFTIAGFLNYRSKSLTVNCSNREYQNIEKVSRRLLISDFQKLKPFKLYASESDSETPSVPEKSEEEEPLVNRRKAKRERGQTTAIVTGAISVALGVAYLVLVQLLDTRGVKLVPPPPEAFGE